MSQWMTTVNRAPCRLWRKTIKKARDDALAFLTGGTLLHSGSAINAEHNIHY